MAIDLVYNCLTDFALTEPAHALALFADKRKLTLLCNADKFKAMGVPEDT